MASFYRVRIPALTTNRGAVQPSTDGSLHFDCFVEADLLGNGTWTPVEGSSHFDVVLPAGVVAAIDVAPTPPNKLVQLRNAIVAADARLQLIKQADVDYRKAVNWLNVAAADATWNL